MGECPTLFLFLASVLRLCSSTCPAWASPSNRQTRSRGTALRAESAQTTRRHQSHGHRQGRDIGNDADSSWSDCSPRACLYVSCCDPLLFPVAWIASYYVYAVDYGIFVYSATRAKVSFPLCSRCSRQGRCDRAHYQGDTLRPNMILSEPSAVPVQETYPPRRVC